MKFDGGYYKDLPVISIWEFTDGYYAVGKEGEKKTFLPSFELARGFYNHLLNNAYDIHKGWLGFNKNHLSIRKDPMSFSDLLNKGYTCLN